MTELRNQTIERLLSAIRQSGEFPAMAKTVGLIGSLTSSEATINYLKVLRGQAVLAIRQKASRPAGRR